MGYRQTRRLNQAQHVRLVSVYPGERNGCFSTEAKIGYHIEFYDESQASLRRVAIKLPIWNCRKALGVLFRENPNLPISNDPELIPTEIALDGKPAIATYLLTICELSESEAAEKLGIKQSTLREYIGRYKRNG